MEGKVFMRQYLIWVMVLLGHIHGHKSCNEEERKAFLELKRHIISHSIEGAPDFVLPTWTNDTNTDCCRWEGVECNHTSGRVTKISFGDLYFNGSYLLNLSLLHPFEEVRSLDLYSSGFSGLFDDVEGYHSLKRLRNLEILNLTSNKFNNSIFPFLNAATPLTTLFLQHNNMTGPFPDKELKDLTNLKLLDLSGNNFSGSLQVRELYALKNLEVLGLRGNEFTDSMGLQGICKLKNLEELDISHNKLAGEFTLCMTTLTGLRVLDLSWNQMTGKLPSDLGNLESLEYLSLSYNNFEGFFSLGWLANLSKLKVLRLDSKSNSLQVKSESSWRPKFQLSVIALGTCNLEKIPHFLLFQKDLRHVDLSSNKISGKFPSWLLENNTKLEVLLLQNNSFTSFHLPNTDHNLLCLNVSVNEFDDHFPENIGWIFPRLGYMNLAHNAFRGNLPSSLGNMEMLESLDISHNSFHGVVPRSFIKSCYSIKFLKLSHNKLGGEIFLESANFTGLQVLSLDNNQFTGNIGQGWQSSRVLYMLDISNNNLTGVIPSWIGELSSLTVLLLSNNWLEGEIPISLFNISSLRLMDLSANGLYGDIPAHLNYTYGIVLLLQDNNLSGIIRDTLLEKVQVLDLRNNRVSGIIPEFINAQNINILLLRGNNLTGRIPHHLCGLINIQLLDLASNKLNGSIPSCLSDTSFGLGKGDAFYGYNCDFTSTEQVAIYFKSLLVLDKFTMVHYDDTLTKLEFATKHRYDAYMGGNLEYLFGLDLSENELSGEIPVELGDLMELHTLNLSHNNLSGVIPESFSSLKNIESLDLSFNRLQGRIPSHLAQLSNLAVFNVSFNNLSGIIPHGKQFNTFDSQRYLGNHFLCGQPTNMSCGSNNFQEPDNGVGADESTIDMVSFYWSFAAAYVTILLGIFASLSFDSPWSRFWFYIVDIFIHKARNLL